MPGTSYVHSGLHLFLMVPRGYFRCELESLEVLGVQHTRAVTRLDPLQRQRCNQRSTNTATVLGSQDLHGILLLATRGLLRPVEDLTQGLGTALLEVGVLVEDGAVGADVARLVALLLADGGDTAGREASGAGANELGQAADELELATGAVDAETSLEEIGCLLEVLEGVPKACQPYCLVEARWWTQ